jgi:hypothetical protein
LSLMAYPLAFVLIPCFWHTGSGHQLAVVLADML